jgi:hypothetical protein
MLQLNLLHFLFPVNPFSPIFRQNRPKKWVNLQHCTPRKPLIFRNFEKSEKTPFG